LSRKTEKKNSDIERIIKSAVQAGLEAGRIQAERTATDAYKATERRLYALPTLKKKVEDARERLAELQRRSDRAWGYRNIREQEEDTLQV